ncbi:protein-L-isoaspartate(D-aspartate) O-methyltransferase [Lipingzhangella halophila]|uniref:Protein-L-isoaspartate O-methyltransferase n=1 Tax=Lipingzhangella halophila TaxID=1783352 RepID=A0A7W7RML3_9ACTN|nr:methyltransferase domain-containing protein [Lipingzhangella halophila]MBB4934764.1 protein-L-isoaspartate(D-aspartate) O-methyltransferase [Lipingzhangella halophila]
MATPGPDDLAHLFSPEWATAMRAAPREHFIPDAARATPMGDTPGNWIDRATDPAAWREAVYSDTTILTQIDDGDTDLTAETAQRGTPSSSNTAPSLVAEFLELLDPYLGDRVLEVGTGTGWTAALLSVRVGAENVTTVEVDPAVAEQAQANLKRAGYAPHVVVTDGAQGHARGAPYDRVHVTCGVREIPYAWVEQTRPGGVIVTPWMPANMAGHQLRIVVTGDVGVGRICGEASFMMLREQRFRPPDAAPDARISESRVDPRRVSYAGSGLRVALAGLIPGVSFSGLDRPDGLHQVAVRHGGSGSDAVCRATPGEPAEVKQYGPRSLWDELELAYLAWVSWGEPQWDRFGVTVDADGQHVWLDSPTNRIAEVQR